MFREEADMELKRSALDDMGFKAVGKNVKIYPGAKIVGCQHITIGDNVIIDDFVFIYATENISIGSYVHMASFCSITGGGVVVVDDFCAISSGVRIMCGSDDFHGGGLTNSTIPADFRKVHRGHIRIGRHSIIGANSTVLPDVDVADGSAIGAQSLVNRSTQPWGIYCGVPARRIANRPSAEILRLERELIARDSGLGASQE